MKRSCRVRRYVEAFFRAPLVVCTQVFFDLFLDGVLDDSQISISPMFIEV